MRKEQYWKDPHRVKGFASKAVDKRLEDLLKNYSSPSHVRILDLGCAGGRNTIFLAEQGFDLWAVDFSGPMVTIQKAN